MKKEEVTSCYFCGLLIGKQEVRKIETKEGKEILWCGRCERDKVVSSSVEGLCRQDHHLGCEMYLIERLTDITDEVFVRLYCEKYSCAYMISYKNKWRGENALFDFIQQRIGTNTKFVRFVPGIGALPTNEDDSPLREKWSDFSEIEIEKEYLLKRKYQPRLAYLIDNEDMELFSLVHSPDDRKVFLVAINYALFYPYSNYSEFLQFDLIEDENEELYMRILDGNRMIAFLKVEEFSYLPKEEHDDWMKNFGYICSNRE